jgi:hypothetical protein
VLLAILSAVGGLPFLGAVHGTQYTFENIELNQSDVLIVIITPPPADLQVNVEQLSGNRHALLIRTNESSQDIISSLRITSPFSVIQLGVEGELYNVTIEFVAQSETRLYYGALTLYPSSNYPGRLFYTYSDAYLVPFSPVLSMPAGNVTISMAARFEMSQQNQNGGSILPPITLSDAAKLVLFAAIAIGISYGEVFFLLSSYFQNKLSGLSAWRKVLALLSVLVAAVAIAWLYGAIVG